MERFKCDSSCQPNVEFKQANLTREAMIDKAYEREGGAAFDYVFNCAALTKYGQEEVVYQESVYDLSVKCARAAAKFKCKRFVELSTAQVYASDKVRMCVANRQAPPIQRYAPSWQKASDESDKLKPWTGIAAMKLRVEEELAKIDGCVVAGRNWSRSTTPCPSLTAWTT
jgi:nucleoside-diphosphate-sugar epimerase